MRTILFSWVCIGLTTTTLLAHADEIVVDFSGATKDNIARLDSPYQGLLWSGFEVASERYIGGWFSYLPVVLQSGGYIGLTDPGVDQWIVSEDDEGVFDFSGAYMGMGYGPVDNVHNDLAFTMSGYRHGQALYNHEVTLSHGACNTLSHGACKPQWVDASFEQIDALHLHSFRLVGASSYHPNYHLIGIDHFTFTPTASVGQEVIPEPASAAILGLGLAAWAWRRRRR